MEGRRRRREGRISVGASDRTSVRLFRHTVRFLPRSFEHNTELPRILYLPSFALPLSFSFLLPPHHHQPLLVHFGTNTSPNVLQPSLMLVYSILPPANARNYIRVFRPPIYFPFFPFLMDIPFLPCCTLILFIVSSYLIFY